MSTKNQTAKNNFLSALTSGVKNATSAVGKTVISSSPTSSNGSNNYIDSLKNYSVNSGTSNNNNYVDSLKNYPANSTVNTSGVTSNTNSVTRNDEQQGSNRFYGNVTHNGQDIDLSRNYQTEINEALAAGDYATANQLANARNAKIDYLNSMQGGYAQQQGWQTTGDYSFNSFSDLPSNWSTAVIGGNSFSNIDGKYYDSNNKYVGSGYNSATDSFTHSDRNSATHAAYDYLASNNTGLSKYGLEASDYYDSMGSVSSSFIDAVQNGTVDNWQKEKAAEKEKWNMIMSLFEPTFSQPTYEEMSPVEDTYTPKDDSLNGKATESQKSYSQDVSNYLDYIGKQLGKNRVSKF